MKLIKTLTLLLAISFAGSLFAQHGVPDVTVKSLDGKSQNLKDLITANELTIISFWATWCTPCKKELDAMADLYPEWQEDYKVELMAISIDNARQLAKVPGIVETKRWEYTILSGDQNEMQNAFNFQMIPQTFIANKAGEIVYTHSGYVPGDEYELEDHIKELVKKK